MIMMVLLEMNFLSIDTYTDIFQTWAVSIQNIGCCLSKTVCPGTMPCLPTNLDFNEAAIEFKKKNNIYLKTFVCLFGQKFWVIFVCLFRTMPCLSANLDFNEAAIEFFYNICLFVWNNFVK